MFEMDPAFGHCDPRQSAPPLLHALTSSNACMPHNPKHHTAVAVRRPVPVPVPWMGQNVLLVLFFGFSILCVWVWRPLQNGKAHDMGSRSAGTHGNGMMMRHARQPNLQEPK